MCAPSNSAFSSPPAGVVFDTPEQIVAAAAAIEEQAVRLRAMLDETNRLIFLEAGGES